MLSSRVFVPQPPDPTQEDIFSSSLSSLFTDDTQNSHGVPGQSVTYDSPRYGNISLGIPQHPDVEEGRKLFAHNLWNAGMVVADAIEQASFENADPERHETEHKVRWNKNHWDMRGCDVLELGSVKYPDRGRWQDDSHGTALPSIISALAGANSITITDHPSSPALTNSTISQNVERNLNRRSETPPSISGTSTHSPRCSVTIAGLTWGDPYFTSATKYGKLTEPQPARNSFHKIIIADCLWMPSQHMNLIKTVNMWLRPPIPPTTESKPSMSRSFPCALVVAGFHTGRYNVACFFELATTKYVPGDDIDGTGDDPDESSLRGTLNIADIFEVDVDLNRRSWMAERPGESKDAAKRWCVCAVLVRRS